MIDLPYMCVKELPEIGAIIWVAEWVPLWHEAPGFAKVAPALPKGPFARLVKGK